MPGPHEIVGVPIMQFLLMEPALPDEIVHETTHDDDGVG